MVFVFTINESFLAPLSVVLASIIASHAGEDISCYILHDGISTEDQEKIQTFATQSGIKSFFKKLSIELFKDFPVRLHFNLANYYRLLIPDMVAEDKAIYLDADIIVRDSLRPLWEMDISGKLLAACPNFASGWHLNLETDPCLGYFNSGVMVLNLAQWRQVAFATKVLHFIQVNYPLIRFADQCGLNACAIGAVKKLGMRYNFQGLYYDNTFELPKACSQTELDLALLNPAVIHFTGSKKPWHWGCKHPDRKLYWKYLSITPYNRRFPQNPSLFNWIRELLPKRALEIGYSVKNSLKNQLKLA